MLLRSRSSSSSSHASSVPVWNSPAANQSSSSSSASSGAVVFTPSTSSSRSARRARAERAVAVAAPDDHLAEQRVVERRDLAARLHPGVDADPRPGGQHHAVERPGTRHEVVRRVLGVDAQLDRAAARRDVLLAQRAAARRRRSAAARRSRSTPVIASVTGCSTWMRVFISMKKNSPLAASTRNSTVPALR